jgi:branched-subunit amino acid transport protein
LNSTWAAVVAVGIGTIALKGAGPVGVAGRTLPPRVLALLSLVGPAILAALVVNETFAHGRSLVVDARLAGVAAGAVAVLLRAPIWVVVIAGAAATAAARALS